MTTTALEPGVVTCLDEMLSGEECADILDELKYAWWWGSPLVQRGSDGALVSRRSYQRTSSTTSEEWMGERTVQLLRRRVQPSPGRVLVWPNLLPDNAPDPRMRHIASPARRTKTTLTVWERECRTRRTPPLEEVTRCQG